MKVLVSSSTQYYVANKGKNLGNGGLWVCARRAHSLLSKICRDKAFYNS
jgi:hypothetical protein